MTEEEFDREKDYLITAQLLRRMLEAGIIDKRDYERMDKAFLEKYQPVMGRVYSHLDLLSVAG